MRIKRGPLLAEAGTLYIRLTGYPRGGSGLTGDPQPVIAYRRGGARFFIAAGPLTHRNWMRASLRDGIVGMIVRTGAADRARGRAGSLLTSW
jgi:hypothetical protein